MPVLSAGENAELILLQQRVAIVRAIVVEPTLVLADEPMANLDTVTADTLLDVMGGLYHELKTTVMERAHRLIRMRDGRIESDEAPAPAEPARG